MTEQSTCWEQEGWDVCRLREVERHAGMSRGMC